MKVTLKNHAQTGNFDIFKNYSDLRLFTGLEVAALME